jgi:hypothetical protein
MEYFDNVKLNDEVYGFIYGKGTVTYVINDQFDIDGFYAFEVTYDNGESVFYTKEGVPNWCNSAGCLQTVYWRDDIDLIDEDFSPSEGSMAPKKIMKLRLKDKLEMKCPSGIWRSVSQCPESVFLGAITKEQYYLFRKKN